MAKQAPEIVYRRGAKPVGQKRLSTPDEAKAFFEVGDFFAKDFDRRLAADASGEPEPKRRRIVR